MFKITYTPVSFVLVDISFYVSGQSQSRCTLAIFSRISRQHVLNFKFLEMHVKILFCVTLDGHVQNLKPVQNCIGFILCTFHVVIHL